jgi:AcrR family transcriptional regulator
MATPTSKSSTRTELLEAAYRILLRDGPGQITLDAVVQESGRSKGGVLYHFPTKEALLAGMVGLVLDRFDADVERARAADEGGAGAWLRAYLAASTARDPDAPAAGAGLLAVVAANPGLLTLARAHAAAWQERLVADGIDPTLATVVRLAVDGLAMADLFDLAPPTGEQRERVLAALMDLTRREVSR